MSIYICEKCGYLDNTACGGNYWSRNVNPEEDQRALCALCFTGKWHDHFERIHWSSYGVDKIISLQERCDGSMVNGVEYLKQIGELPMDFCLKIKSRGELATMSADNQSISKEKDTRRNRRGKIKAGKRKY